MSFFKEILERLKTVVPITFFQKKKQITLGFNERTKLYSRVRRLVMAGKPYSSVLFIIRDLAAKRKQTTQTKRRLAVYDKAVERMRESNVGLGAALEGSIPEVEKNLITAAEAGSHVEIGLDSAILISRLSGEIKTEIIMAILSPVVILTVLFGGMYFFGFVVLPEFASFMPVDQWEPLGQKLYYITTTLPVWAPIFISTIVFLTLGFVYSLNNWIGPGREKIDELVPVYRVNKTVQSSVILISLSAYMRSGIPFLNAINKINNETKSLWVKRNLEKISSGGREKGNLGEAMMVPMFDEESREDIAIFSRATPEDFAESLAEIGEEGISRARDDIKAMATKLKVMLTVFMGATILGLYVAVITVGNNLSNAV